MTAVDTALTEVAASLAILQPQLEGLRDYARLDLHEETRFEVGASIQQYTRRETLLLAVRDALEALVQDGYPVMDVRQLDQAIYADLQENAATIEAALAQFAPAVQAATLRTAAGRAEPKAAT